MAISARVRIMRMAADLSTRELARLSGLSSSYVSHLETGQLRNPRASSASALACVLGCSVGWLLFGEGRAPTRDEVLAAVTIARRRAA